MTLLVYITKENSRGIRVFVLLVALVVSLTTTLLPGWLRLSLDEVLDFTNAVTELLALAAKMIR